MADKRRQPWLRAIERALFAIAAVCLVWYATVHIDAAREQAALSDELERSRATLAEAPRPAPVPAVNAVARTPAPRTTTMPASRAAPAARDFVARIEVPRLRLSAFAREGVDLRTLRGSVGHVPGSALPGEVGNAAFAAHRDTYFRPLKGVRDGDTIRITTPAGAFTYVVSGTKIVEPEDVSVLRPTDTPTLTLVTCYPFNYIGSAPQRFIVTARLADR